MGADPNREQPTIQVPEIFRVRRDQAVSLISIPVVLTIIGLLFGFARSIYTDRDARIQLIRSEIRETYKDAAHQCEREVERLEARQEKRLDNHERRLVWIEQAVNKSEKD